MVGIERRSHNNAYSCQSALKANGSKNTAVAGWWLPWVDGRNTRRWSKHQSLPKTASVQHMHVPCHLCDLCCYRPKRVTGATEQILWPHCDGDVGSLEAAAHHYQACWQRQRPSRWLGSLPLYGYSTGASFWVCYFGPSGARYHPILEARHHPLLALL
jgi:hypothetical protein